MRNVIVNLAARALFALALIVVMAGAGPVLAQTAQVQVIHNSPDPAATTVDVYLGDTLALPDFAFRAATPVLDLPAGVEIVIGIAPGNSGSVDDVIASFPVTLTPGEGYVVMAAGTISPGLPTNPDGRDVGFSLFVSPGLRSAGTGGNVDLLAFHGAPDAPAVDVRSPVAGVLFGDLAFGEFSADYLSVPPASYTLNVAPAGSSTVVASFVANLGGLGGGAAVVFASGYLSGAAGAPFGLFAALPSGVVIELPAQPVSSENASWGGMKSSWR